MSSREVYEMDDKIFRDGKFTPKDFVAENVIIAADEQGYVAGRIVFESAEETECEILRLGVLPQFRNCGAGLRLLRKFLEILSDRSKNVTVFLEVREDNAAARKLYENAGFEKISVRKNYYDDGCAAVCMKLGIVCQIKNAFF